jgi:hypothetical protein
MKTLILFREGLSGHYLKSLIDDEPVDVKFRMDPWYPGIYDTLTPPAEDQSCVCLHQLPDAVYADKFDRVFTMLVNKSIYHAIYNVFTKKVLVEQSSPDEFACWQDNMVTWYDRCYYNIEEYWGLFRQDAALGQVIDFDQILDADYMDQLFQQHYGRTLSDNQRRIVTEYSAKQLNLTLSTSGTSMQEIVDAIPDHLFRENPWFAAYCLFKFEKNNQLPESNRLWTIDDVTQPIDRVFLLSVAQQYRTS